MPDFRSQNFAIIGVKWTLMKRNDIFIADGNAAGAETKIYRKSDIKDIKSIISAKDIEFWNISDGSKEKSWLSV